MIHPNVEHFDFSLLWVETPTTRKLLEKHSIFFIESGEIKSRSPFSTAAVGFLGLPGSKMYQFLHWRDSLF